MTTLSSTLLSTADVNCPITLRVARYVEPMLNLSSTAAASWESDQPNTSQITHHQLNALLGVLVRWNRPAINRLLDGLRLPLITEDERDCARRMLSLLVEAVIDELKTASEDESWQEDRPLAIARSDADQRLDPREEESLYRIVLGMAIHSYGYLGPHHRSTAASEIEHRLRLSGIDLDRKTIKKFLDRAARRLGANLLYTRDGD